MTLLAITNLRKVLGGRQALDGADILWDGPGTLVIFGENGAGKSTLLRVVAGILQADEGEVTIAGHRLSRDRVSALKHVGYAPEAADLPPHLGVGELVALAAALKGADRPSPALVDRLGAGPLMNKRFGALSLGQKRRAGLLAALVGDPALLVLDEPTNGLDADGVAVIADLLRERKATGKAALCASHDRAFIDQIGAEVVKIESGKARHPAT